MNELVQLVQQKTGLSQDVAEQAVNAVVGYLKTRMPAGMSAGLDQLMGDTASADAGAPEGGLMDKAKSMVAGIMGSKDA